MSPSEIAKLGRLMLLIGLMHPAAHAELAVEPLTLENLPKPSPHWMWLNDIAYFAMSDGRAYLLDGDSGKMVGMLSTGYAFNGVVTSKSGAVYTPEIYFSRGTRGTRTDVITIYEPGKLNPGPEIAIPSKRVAMTPMVNGAVLLDDEALLLVYNFTPAQSISVVDVKRRRFVGEIETAGCALIYPSGPRSFFSLCSDGKILTANLDDAGKLKNVVRSAPFLDVKSDPVTEKGVRVGDTWYFVSFAGQVYPIKANAQGVQMGEKWWLTTADERKQGWRSGGLQHLAVHRSSNRLYAIMHQGSAGSHKEPGREVWIYDLASKQCVQKIPLRGDATSIQVTQDPKPLLFSAFFGGNEVGIYDAKSGKFQRAIRSIGLTPTTLVNP